MVRVGTLRGDGHKTLLSPTTHSIAKCDIIYYVIIFLDTGMVLVLSWSSINSVAYLIIFKKKHML